MRRIYSGCASAVTVVAALAATSRLHAQPLSREPTAAEVAALLRGQGHAGGAVAVLTQAYSPQPRRKMDDIADSLVAIATGFPGDDLRGARTRGAALSTLLLAGIGTREVTGFERPIPYAGAADRFMRIAETAQDVGISGGALRALTELPDKTRLLPFLRKVATSQNVAAWVAVTILVRDTGPEGQAIARELYGQRLVTERSAREVLDRLAAAYELR